MAFGQAQDRTFLLTDNHMITLKNPLPKPPAPKEVVNNIARKLSSHLPQIIRRLPDPPFVLQKTIAEKLLEQLMAEPIELGDFDFLQDKWLQLSINDLGLTFFLTFQDQKLLLSNRIQHPDVSFSGDSREFVLLASRIEDPDTLFFQRRLVIEGDTELGLCIKNTVDGIDFEQWPAWLNRIIQSVATLVGASPVNPSREALS